MLINNPFVFYSVSVLIIIFAISALACRNIIYSLLSIIVVFFLTSIIFYMLGSEYNAIIQAAIYGVAIPIITALSIMFISKNNNEKNNKNFLVNYILIISSAVFIMAFVYVVMISLSMRPDTFMLSDFTNISAIDVLNTFSQSIFRKYAFAFELLSILLTIIIVGLTMLKKGENN